jgi:hypothetical protein
MGSCKGGGLDETSDDKKCWLPLLSLLMSDNFWYERWSSAVEHVLLTTPILDVSDSMQDRTFLGDSVFSALTLFCVIRGKTDSPETFVVERSSNVEGAKGVASDNTIVPSVDVAVKRIVPR